MCCISSKVKVHLVMGGEITTGWPDKQSFKCTCGLNDLIDLWVCCFEFPSTHGSTVLLTNTVLE